MRKQRFQDGLRDHAQARDQPAQEEVSDDALSFVRARGAAATGGDWEGEESMKAYILTDADVQSLLLLIERNPEHGINGGCSSVLNDVERTAHQEAHRFYNYQVHKWLSAIGAES
jgi:hypothetical protein